jgi:hypothetical protein
VKPTVSRRCYTWDEAPAIPVEFSGAAYRFGHSMVREDYTLNATPAGQRLPIFRAPGEPGEDLTGFRRLPTGLTIEWQRFFRLGPTPLRAMRIDASLATGLAHVPPDGAALAHLNLRRHRALRLPAGSDVAVALDMRPLDPADLVPEGIAASAIPEPVMRSPPLWYYILCEAKKLGEDGSRLGPVGGRIVAEVLVGLLEADRHSYLNAEMPWSPELPLDAHGKFTMAQLVKFATGAPAPAAASAAPPSA